MKAFVDGLRLFFGARLADQHVNPAVAQVERNRASHVAIADDADTFSGENVQIAIFVMINDRHVV